MSPRSKITIITNPMRWVIAAWVFALASPALASEAYVREGSTAPCAVIESLSGNAQVLDSSRSQMRDAAEKVSVSCGGWVSVEQGWVTLTHRFGYRIHLGASSFSQFLDGEDAVLLFRGQIFAQAGGGMGELRILTPNARAKLTRSSVVALFDPTDEKTQLIAVDGQTLFENRFKTAKNGSVTLKAGESSSLDFQFMRVIPSVPKAVATASLRAKLKELNVPARQTDRAIAVARHRQQQVFVSAKEAKKGLPEKTAHHEHDATRSPASQPDHRAHRAPAKHGADSPNKHGAKRSHDENFDTNSYLVHKVVGGSEEGVKILSPGKKGGKPRKAEVKVEDPEAKLAHDRQVAEDAEKQRLIEELTKIKSE